MEDKKENSPFVIEFKNNYGTAATATSDAIAGGGSRMMNDRNLTKMPGTPTTLYCLHGRDHIELRGHCHRQRSEGVDVRARKKLIVASVLCLLFMIAEIIGGILSNSLAIATDAAHLLTDFASFMISLFAIWIAGRPSTQRMSFGWYRAEVIGALASVVMIWVITAILVWLAINRLVTGDFEVDAKIMLITSGLAIVINLIMGFQLQHGHSHGGGGHSHTAKSKQLSSSVVAAKKAVPAQSQNHTITTTTTPTSTNGAVLFVSPGDVGGLVVAETNLTTNKQKVSYQQSSSVDELRHASGGHITEAYHPHQHENMNVRAALIHVVGDVLQSVGVFCAALLIFFKPEWAIADPICTFVFSVIVLFTTFAIIKDALLVLMEGTPSYLHYAEVLEIFEKIEGVQRVHNLRIWALSLNKIALSVHLAVEPGANPKKILEAATTAVHLKYNFFETTIQIEDFTPEMENCQQCIVPES